MSDGTSGTGFLFGDIIELMSPDGTSMRTGTITKNADGSESIDWNAGAKWMRFPEQTTDTSTVPTDTPNDPPIPNIWLSPTSCPTYNGGNGLTPWVNEPGDEVSIVKGKDRNGEEIVIILGLLPWFVTGFINGNEIVVPDPNDPEYPIIGIISPDGKTIEWTQAGAVIMTFGRWDVDECTADPAYDPCASETGTICYNTDPGFTCNCNVVGQWSTADGSFIQVHIDSTTQPKAAVTYTMADGSVTTGTLLGNTIAFLNSDGSEKIGFIKKNADGSESITWNDGTGWGRVSNSTPVPVPNPVPEPVPVPVPVPVPECGANEHWVECDYCTENDCKYGMACAKKCSNDWSECCIIENQCACNPGYARYTGAHFYLS